MFRTSRWDTRSTSLLIKLQSHQNQIWKVFWWIFFVGCAERWKQAGLIILLHNTAIMQPFMSAIFQKHDLAMTFFIFWLKASHLIEKKTYHCTRLWIYRSHLWDLQFCFSMLQAYGARMQGSTQAVHWDPRHIWAAVIQAHMSYRQRVSHPGGGFHYESGACRILCLRRQRKPIHWMFSS